MPWSGSTFIRDMGPYDGATCWQETDAANYGIQADHHDVHDQDMADGINACINRAGANVVQANIPMGGFKLTGLAAGTAAGDSVRFEQLESGVMTTRGDMLYRSDAGTARLPKGGNGQFLTMGANDPQWTTPGFGTAAFYNVSASGDNVPLLTGANNWTTAQSINAASTGGGALGILVTNGAHNIPAIAFFLPGPRMTGSITYNGPIPGTEGMKYNETSDGRLKQNRRPLDNSGVIIDALQPLYYRWGGQGDEDYGFVAQDLAAIPQLARNVIPGDDNPDKRPGDAGYVVWQNAVGKLEAILVAELKALRRRVAELENAAA